MLCLNYNPIWLFNHPFSYSSSPPFFIFFFSTLLPTMASSSTSLPPPTKRPRITIIPPKALFIDLTHEDTPSPKAKSTSPLAPSAPIKTPSTRGTSSSSSRPNSSPFSPFVGNLSPLLRLSITPPSNTNLSLSPNGPLDYTPSTPPPSPIMGHPIAYNFVNHHSMSCACCFHNFNLISSLRDELHYMFGHIEYLLSQPHVQPTPLATMPSTPPHIIIPPPSSPPSN